MALGARDALREVGLAVPRDVLLVGYDDIPLARYVEPPLTTVRGDLAPVGALATIRLLELVESRRPDALVTSLPTHLVVRSSCGCGILPSVPAQRGAGRRHEPSRLAKTSRISRPRKKESSE